MQQTGELGDFRSCRWDEVDEYCYNWFDEPRNENGVRECPSSPSMVIIIIASGLTVSLCIFGLIWWFHRRKLSNEIARRRAYSSANSVPVVDPVVDSVLEPMKSASMDRDHIEGRKGSLPIPKAERSVAPMSPDHVPIINPKRLRQKNAVSADEEGPKHAGSLPL